MSEQDLLQKQLEMHKQRLSILEIQEAGFGRLHVPVHILIEIEDARLGIIGLEEKLGLSVTVNIVSKYRIPWNVPHRRNPSFSERAEFLTNMEKTLAGGRLGALTLTISGLGGVGKTQLAVEYAYRHSEKFKFVWWLRAESEITIKADLAWLASQLNLPEAAQSDQNLTITAILRWLENNDGWLLIFDDANNPKDVQDYLPKGGRGQILITSRWQDWTGYAKTISVQVWNKTSAVEFLLRRTMRNDKEGAGKLVEKLGYLPLALEHVGAYLAQNQLLTFADYLQKFEQQKLSFLAEGQLATDYHQDTIRSTWQISRQQLPFEATDLLKLCAWLAPDNIPLAMFLNNVEELPESLAIVAASKISFAKTVATLQQYSLAELNQENQAISVHPLLQLVLREVGEERDQGQGLIQHSSKSATITPQSFWLSSAVRLINVAFPIDSDDYRNWEECTRLLPHALAVSEEAERLEMEPSALGHLLTIVGIYLQSRADYQTALDLYQRSIAIGEKTLDAENPDVATRYNNLGSLLRAMGNLPSARIYLERAIVIGEKILGNEHPDVAIYYNNLGQLLQNLGDLPNARIYLEKALAIDEKVYGYDHPIQVRDYNNLGSLLRVMGDLPSARIYLERAIVISEKILGNEHPDVAIYYNNLGQLLQDLGDLPSARIYLERAIVIGEKILGNEHPDVATRYNNLGQLLWAMGDLPKARIYLEKALAIFEKMLGPIHPNVAQSYNNLGRLFQDLGDYSNAHSFFKKTLKLQIQRLAILENQQGKSGSLDLQDYMTVQIENTKHEIARLVANLKDNPLRNKILISYSRKDTRWVDRLSIHLSPLINAELIELLEVSEDLKILTDKSWLNKFQKTLAISKVVVLLISENFPASNFIDSGEIGSLLETADQEGVNIIPVMVSPVRDALGPLTRFQEANFFTKPLIQMKKREQDEFFINLVKTLINSIEPEME